VSRLRRFSTLVGDVGFGRAMSMAWSWVRWKMHGSRVPKAPSTAGDWVQVHQGLRPDQPVGASLISIVVPVYEPVEEHFRACISSIRLQTYDRWELVLVDDASPSAHVGPLLADIASTDPRIRVVTRDDNGGIAAATNTGIQEATGEFIAFMDQDDVLIRTALEWIATCTDAADLIYTDEAKIDDEGTITDRVLKPSWSPRLLLGYNYISHLTVVRTELARSLGGLTADSSGAQDHDFLIRLSELPITVAHVPCVLYLWRRSAASTADDPAAKPYAELAGLTAVERAIQRRGWHAEAVLGRGDPFRYAVQWTPHVVRPLVKVVIPTRDRVDLLRVAMSSLINRTDDVDIHLVIVDNGSEEPETLAYLEDLAGRDFVSIVRHDDAFNFSRLCNLGVEAGPATEFVLFLNNDAEILHRAWLNQMVGWFADPEVVAVGVELLYEDRETIQHAGVAVGSGHIGWHFSTGLPNQPRSGDHHASAHEVTGVTAACMLVRTAAFDAVGGFEEILPTDFQDVDLCLKLTRGLCGVIVYEPMYPLLHHESASRGDLNAGNGYTISRMKFRWPGIAESTDPYFHPLAELPYLGEFAMIETDGDFVHRLAPRFTTTLGWQPEKANSPAVGVEETL
jgi:O-antigen biosynthesis protein